MKLKKMYPLCFFMFFSYHLPYKHYYCTLYSLTCSTIKKLITLVHILQIGMPHSTAYYCVTRRHSLHWHRIYCCAICSTVWLQKEKGFSHNWTNDKKNGVNVCNTSVWTYGLPKNTHPVVFDAPMAHHTPNFTSCNGKSWINKIFCQHAILSSCILWDENTFHHETEWAWGLLLHQTLHEGITSA
jgi:hypothetical protein